MQNIEAFLKVLNSNKELISYLFMHRDKKVAIDEIIDISSYTKIEILEHLDIIESDEDTIALDERVIGFFEEYLNIDDSIEVSSIDERLKNIKHLIALAKKSQNKERFIAKIKRELKKIDYALFRNLDRLRVHIDRVYKSVEEFSLKLQELKFYQTKLKEFTLALSHFEEFLKYYSLSLENFYDSSLNELLKSLNKNRVLLNRSLIPLSQDIISYINLVQQKSEFVEKVIKLKELKDILELRSTNLEEHLDSFDILDKSIKISTKLDTQILEDEGLEKLIAKISHKSKLKTKKAPKIIGEDGYIQREYIDINALNLQFRANNLSLIEFLLYNSNINDFEEVVRVYCKMVLMFEQKYTITDKKFIYNGCEFLKVYYES